MKLRIRALSFDRMRPGRALVALLALLVLASGALAQGRLEPHERERLRHELREQAREDRHRMRDQGPTRDDARRGVPPVHGPPARPVDVAGWRSEALEPGRSGEPRPRMSPEEREALRVQLRERRRPTE